MRTRVLVGALWVAGFLFAATLPMATSSCRTGYGRYDPTTGVYDTNAMASAVVVTVEEFREAALQAFDTLMMVERQHEAELRAINPKIHDVAEDVRRNGRRYLDALTEAKLAFQRNRTEANATALRNALASARVLLRSVTGALAESAKGTR